MINYNLAGKALLHCLKVPDSKLLLVDQDSALQGRIEDERGYIEGELGTQIKIMSPETIQQIRSLKSERPDDAYRSQVKGDWPMVMFFTRYEARLGWFLESVQS